MPKEISQGKSHFSLRYITQSNVFKRTVLGIIMLSLFVRLCESKPIYIITFVIALCLGICYELINLVRKNNRPLSLNWAIVLLYVLILFSIKVIPTMIKIYPRLRLFRVFSNHGTILFYAYALCTISVILSFRKDKLSSQLLLLAMVHLAAYILGLSSARSITNIERGRFYFFYPCILVISNDISAYVIGKLFGKTKLYDLSPKKTVEGFVGAFFFTLLTGMLLVYLKLYCGFLPDEMDSIIAHRVNPAIWFLDFPVMHIHNLSFALYASFVAPFAGFFASAIKRAFHKKDFGSVIPGHGGLTDRMDCQLLMLFFTHFYLNSFFKPHAESLEYLSTYIRENYCASEIATLIDKIK